MKNGNDLSMKVTAGLDEAVVKATEKVLREQLAKAAAFDQVMFLLREAAYERGIIMNDEYKPGFEYYWFQQTDGMNLDQCDTLHEAIGLFIKYVCKPIEKPDTNDPSH